LPGGVVELGETLREAVERELREELSINVEIGGCQAYSSDWAIALHAKTASSEAMTNK